jgi:Flp pilus assembly pilin Flp
MLMCYVFRCFQGHALRQRDHGATAVEYSLMIGLIAAVIFSAVFAFGQGVLGLFNAAVAAF